jgi:tetratricopeptide (TPR) repeat protein
MRVMSVTKLVEGMQKRFRLLTGGASARHETLALAIDGSWELLQPWEQAALAQCSVFEGGFTLDAAEQVIDLRSWREAPWVIDVVQSLVDKSLLLVRLADGGPSARMPARFGMLVSLQEYARRKLDEADAIPGGGSGTAAARAAEERHGVCFARHGAEDPTESIERDGGDARRQLVYRELDNLVTACRRALGRGDGNTAATVFRAANEVFDRRGPFATAIQLGMEILASELAPELRARTLLAVGTAEARSGRRDAARTHLESALAIFRELGHKSGEGFVLGNLGGVAYSTGKYEEALACYQAAMDIQRAAGNRRMEGANLANIGLVHHTQGNLEQARACFETSAAMQREAGNLRSLGIVLSSLGHLHLHQGRIAEARGCFESALDIHRKLGDRPFIGSVLGNLGTMCLARGQLAEARSYFEAALEVHREVGNRPTEGVILGDLGNVYLDLGLIEPARSTLEAALGISREVGDKRSEGIHLTHLGNVLFEAGRIEEALALEETALALNRQVGHRRFEGITLGYLSLIHLAQGRTDAARSALAAGEAILREMADPLELARLLCARALVESTAGEFGTAGATLGEVEVLAERCGIRPDSELHRRIARVREAVQAHA